MTAITHARGLRAEDLACAALTAEGWTIHARRWRTPVGEVDIVAERDGVIAIIEVKARRGFSAAATALGPHQRRRLIAAADWVLASNPEWGRNGARFDVILVDGRDRLRRIADAFRAGD